ncbi:MAG: hypothetical protein Q8R28_01415 [Dehalococcoidia bacterium]|nr:hypothetical protein [Dehalococcoidia bacterium]
MYGIGGITMSERKPRATFTPAMERQILDYSVRTHRDLGRTKLAELLENEFKDDPLVPITPGVEVIAKKITRYRKTIHAGPQEEPWSMASLEAYPLPPSTLPAVVAARKYSIEHRWGSALSIREAKWVARFSALEPDIAKLTSAAGFYSYDEFYAEATKQPFDSANMDLAIFGIKAVKKAPGYMTAALASRKGGNK